MLFCGPLAEFMELLAVGGPGSIKNIELGPKQAGHNWLRANETLALD